jgi:uncharacterized protein YgiM (DUF1202 family)
MKRVVYTAIGILALTAVAAGLTELAFALGHRGRLADDQAQRHMATPSPSPSPSASATPAPMPTPAATPAPTPVSTPAAATAVTNSFVHMRAGASTTTAIVADLNGGSEVTLGSYRDSQWQQVTYNGLNGYIFRSYLTYR